MASRTNGRSCILKFGRLKGFRCGLLVVPYRCESRRNLGRDWTTNTASFCIECPERATKASPRADDVLRSAAFEACRVVEGTPFDWQGLLSNSAIGLLKLCGCSNNSIGTPHSRLRISYRTTLIPSLFGIHCLIVVILVSPRLYDPPQP